MTTRTSKRIKGFKWLGKTAFTPQVGASAVVALGLPDGKGCGFEMDDPRSTGKRDAHIEFLIHDNKVWQTTWMDRTCVKGKKRYGLIELKGAPVSEFI